MRAGINSFSSPDVIDPEGWTPEDPLCWGILLEACTGPRDDDGRDLGGDETFGFVVCKPRWLERMAREDGFVLGRHHLVVLRYDYEQIVTHIDGIVKAAEGPDWNSVAEEIARYGDWEFEGYRPDTDRTPLRRKSWAQRTIILGVWLFVIAGSGGILWWLMR